MFNGLWKKIWNTQKKAWKKTWPAHGDKRIVGVSLNPASEPTLAFDNGTVLFPGAERVLYPEFFTNPDGWPRDPVTGEKLPTVGANQ